MVNIHVFDISGTERLTSRVHLCFSKTIQHQSDCVVYYWTGSDPEIKELIDNSPYCQKALEWPDKGRGLSFIFQYVKMVILSRYGGWCIELDETVESDLSKIDIDSSKAYLPFLDNAHAAICWTFYIPKGFDLSQNIKIADSVGTTNFTGAEIDICQIEINPNIVNLEPLYYALNLNHYQTPIFTDLAISSSILYDITSDGTIEVTLSDCYNSKTKFQHTLKDWDIFIACCKQFETFSKVFVNIENPKKVILTDKFYRKIKADLQIDFSKFTLLPPLKN